MENMSEEELKEVSGGIYDLVDTQVNGDVTSYTFRRQGGRAIGRRSEAQSQQDEDSVLNALPVNVANLLRSKQEAIEQAALENNCCLDCWGEIVSLARYGVAGFKLNVNNATGEIYYS